MAKITPQEALNQISLLFDYNVHGVTNEAIEYAISAIESLIPEKPIYGGSINTIIPLKCPGCRRILDAESKCCPNCGQALDWSDIG